MKTRSILFQCLWLITFASISNLHAQGTAFTYQGRLNSGTNPVTGSYDLRFLLYNDATAGGVVAGPVTNAATAVSNGLFTVMLDFGAVYDGTPLWLHIGVRTNGAANFTGLSPRQPLTPTPYAVFAEGANAAGLTGTIPAGDLSGAYGGVIVLNNSGNSFSGNGAGLLNVNPSLLGGLAASNFWQTTGNAGTTVGLNFLGTTDNQPLELDAYGVRGLRLEYTSRFSGFPFLFSQAGVNVVGGYWGNFISNNVIGGVVAGGGDQAGGGILFQTPYPNVVVNDFGAVGGGYGNTAGTAATIPGGYLNLATGNGSFAAGRKAITTYDGSFIWSDGTKTNYSSGVNSFDINAAGGVHINGADLYFNPNNDRDYGLGYRASFSGSTVNGPVLYSYLGGALAAVGPDTIALQWDYSGNVTVNKRLTVSGEFSVVNGLGNEQAYMGGDGVGGDVQFGSLNSSIDNVAFYNAGKNTYMHIYCSSITIEGGADLAEPFKISSGKAEISEGTVVVIDEENPGHLKMSDQGYDTHVAGVVSGANGISPGIQMQQKGVMEGGKNVALTGRVYVQADTSNGAIKPGDLLTTSGVRGHAMKVTDHAKAAGAILGKAMTALTQGQGMVLVLVTLQ